MKGAFAGQSGTAGFVWFAVAASDAPLALEPRSFGRAPTRAARRRRLPSYLGPPPSRTARQKARTTERRRRPTSDGCPTVLTATVLASSRSKSATSPPRRQSRLSPSRQGSESSMAPNAKRSVTACGAARNAGAAIAPETGAAAGAVIAFLRPARTRGRRCARARPAPARSSAPVRLLCPFPFRRR